jgi:protoporphyrinogen oxidase
LTVFCSADSLDFAVATEPVSMSQPPDPQPSVAVIGAGPAGLTAAYMLRKRGIPVTVLEADPIYVGGISKTVEYKGYRFDIGGHRFFSKSQEVEDFWTEILAGDLLERPRSSRIYYERKFFSYPLDGKEALLKLGPVEAARCVLSYGKARLFPVANPTNVEDWVINQFGQRLYEIFFKTYTEKVWGMSCREISADWASQRIKGLALGSAIANALRPKRKPKARAQVIKTLIDAFRYPRLGPGQMWEQCARRVMELGGEVAMGRAVTRCSHDAARGLWRVTDVDANGVERVTEAEHVISSAPIRDLFRALDPAPSARARKAAEALRYRDFLVVALMLRDRGRFDDNWIYIQDRGVKVGRVQNFKSWSPEMVPDPAMACYGMEYFCFEGDGLWTSSDDDLVALAKRELEQIGLARAGDVVDGKVVRQRKAYPVYDDAYAANVQAVRDELAERYPTLHLVGRNGMHKYNNQDHSMMTAMLAVENIVAGEPLYDLFRVNEDAEYHEAGKAGARRIGTTPRSVPSRVKA